jgi:nitrite reductase/ring-hydroxylating ferredoxin subunit
VRLELAPDAAPDTPAAIEQALREALPEVQNVQVERERTPPAAQNNFVPLSTLTLRRNAWHSVLEVIEVPVGNLRAIDVGGQRVLLVRAADAEVYAYRNACPGTPFPLDAADTLDGALRCPWHGCLFDLRGGRRLDTQAPGLGVIPVRIDNGTVCVQLAEIAAV